jgi:GGDEF domain-containing protein
MDELRDSMTGLPNRHALERDMEGRPIGAVLFIDYDQMKRLNDLHGHVAGDLVICAVADIVSGIAPGRTYCVGGARLLVVVPLVAETGAIELAERLRAAVAAASSIPPTVDARLRDEAGLPNAELWWAPIAEGLDGPSRQDAVAALRSLTVSIGVATKRTSDADQLRELWRDAAAACQDAKARGGNHVCAEKFGPFSILLADGSSRIVDRVRGGGFIGRSTGTGERLPPLKVIHVVTGDNLDWIDREDMVAIVDTSTGESIPTPEP